MRPGGRGPARHRGPPGRPGLALLAQPVGVGGRLPRGAARGSGGQPHQRDAHRGGSSLRAERLRRRGHLHHRRQGRGNRGPDPVRAHVAPGDQLRRRGRRRHRVRRAARPPGGGTGGAQAGPGRPVDDRLHLRHHRPPQGGDAVAPGRLPEQRGRVRGADADRPRRAAQRAAAAACLRQPGDERHLHGRCDAGDAGALRSRPGPGGDPAAPRDRVRRRADHVRDDARRPRHARDRPVLAADLRRGRADHAGGQDGKSGSAGPAPPCSSCGA